MMRRVLFIAWALAYLLSAACFALLLQGLVRDSGFGDAVVRIDPRAPSPWQAQPFRVWGAGDYALYLSSVNHDPGPIGRPFKGAIDVRVRAPGGGLAFDRSYDAAALDHQVPDNFGSSKLAEMSLDDWPLRAWTLEVRVAQGDPDFVTAQTRVRLKKQRYDPGMGGLVNYAMMVPGGLFALLALGLALVLARRGSPAPLYVTAGTGVVLLLAIELVG